MPHDRALGDATDAQDRDLGVVDNRGLDEASELAGARDCERRAAELVRRERPRACSFRQPLDVGVKLVNRTRVAVTDDRDDESVLRLDGHAEVVAVEVDDRVSLEARVQLRKLAQRFRAGLQHRRHKQL